MPLFLKKSAHRNVRPSTLRLGQQALGDGDGLIRPDLRGLPEQRARGPEMFVVILQQSPNFCSFESNFTLFLSAIECKGLYPRIPMQGDKSCVSYSMRPL